ALQKYLKKPSQPPRIDSTSELKAVSSDLKQGADTGTARLAEIAAKKVAEERAKFGGQSSGKTMMIMASAFKEVNVHARTMTRKRGVKVVAGVAGTALVVVSVLGVVIWRQQKEIDELVQKKLGIDKQIVQVQSKMRRRPTPRSWSSWSSSWRSSRRTRRPRS